MVENIRKNNSNFAKMLGGSSIFVSSGSIRGSSPHLQSGTFLREIFRSSILVDLFILQIYAMVKLVTRRRFFKVHHREWILRCKLACYYSKT